LVVLSGCCLTDRVITESNSVEERSVETSAQPVPDETLLPGGEGAGPGPTGGGGPRAARYNLDGQKLGDSGFAEWLEDAGPGDGIVELRLGNNELTSAAIEALAESKLGAPEVLMLTGNPTGDAGAQAVAQSETFGGLRILYLDNTKTSAVGAKALFGGSSKLRWLEEVVLSGNAIGDEGVAAIAASPGSAHLTGLYLVGVGMTDEGARALANSDHLGNLAQLSVSGNSLTKAGIKALRESSKLPKCELDL
jgi:hypothetical protein